MSVAGSRSRRQDEWLIGRIIDQSPPLILAGQIRHAARSLDVVRNQIIAYPNQIALFCDDLGCQEGLKAFTKSESLRGWENSSLTSKLPATYG